MKKIKPIFIISSIILTLALSFGAYFYVNNAKKLKLVEPSRRKPNAFHLYDSVVIAKPVEEVFSFIEKDLPNCYTQTAQGHLQFKLIDAEKITEGKFIECREISKNVEVEHLYEVKHIKENEAIYFGTELPDNPTKATIKLGNKTINKNSASHIYYNFKEIDSENTEIQLTIIIQLESPFDKFMSTITGGEKLYSDHLTEELSGLKRIIESHE